MRIPLEGTGPVDRALRSRAAAALARALPPAALRIEDEDTRPYETDALTLYRQQPMIVALPGNEQELAAVLGVCRELRLPVVARGAGTGLSGGALPHRAGVLVSLARLNRILELDPRARTARAEPGVRNLAISEAAAPHGLFYAPDPSSQVACTIGGNVAENSGGIHCLKYGLTFHNVLAVRGLTIDGEAVTVGSAAPDAPGLDLLSLVLGSEGMLLVVTEVLLKLLPRPAVARCLMASFAEVEAAGNAVADIIGAGIVPAALEMMDRAATRMVEPFVHAGYDLDAAAILLCESDGSAEDVAEEVERISALLRAAGATRIAIAADEAERQRFWAGRKNAFPAAGRVSPDYYCMDGTIPRRQLGAVLRAIGAMEQKHGLRCPNVFHAGDGNLHPLILFDANDPDSVERADAFGVDILKLCIAVGGTVTGEHGVGVEKLNQVCDQFDAPTREAFFGVRRAFDPDGLLNPGKVIPSLHRCAEYGRQHVHAGRAPFPELPRF
jgi:glycolate dehydrogenase FAD-linked subunit